MTKNLTNVLFFIISILVIVFALYLYNKTGTTADSTHNRNFSIDSDENIVLLELSKKNEEPIRLKQNKSGTWMINDNYTANNIAINDLIRILKNLYIKHPVPIENREIISNNLKENGVKINVFARRYIISIAGLKVIPYRTKIKSFYVGQDDYDAAGTIMQIEGASFPYIVHIPGIDGGISRHFSSNYYEWRDPVVFKLQQSEINSIKVVVNDNSEESFIFYNKNGNFQLSEQNGKTLTGYSLDTMKVQRLLTAFNDLYFEKLLYGEELSKVKEVLNTQSPSYIITVEDSNSKITKIEVYSKMITEKEKEELGITTDVDPNLFYLVVNEKEYSLARYFVFSRILRPLSFYVKKSD
ncbi:MAG: DUF4340 domain-containing protein [Bacteroidetes bacterium]|nr:DUF4340 domain-containing protein [Bacteroidota bacterium]